MARQIYVVNINPVKEGEICSMLVWQGLRVNWYYAIVTVVGGQFSIIEAYWGFSLSFPTSYYHAIIKILKRKLSWIINFLRTCI